MRGLRVQIFGCAEFWFPFFSHIFFWFVRSKQVARERDWPQPDLYPNYNYLKLLIVYRQSITWWCDFNVAYFSPLEFKLSRSTGWESLNPPVPAPVIKSQLIYNFDLMPWNYLSWKYCPFSAFLLEAPSPRPHFSQRSQFLFSEGLAGTGSTRDPPCQQGGSLAHWYAQTHPHSFASPLAAETYKCRFLQMIITVSVLFEQPQVF